MRTGIVDRKPRSSTEPSSVIASVDIETVIALRAGMPSCAIVVPVRPAMSVATGASSRPITATMAPMAAGGKTTSSHRVPATRTTPATRMKNRPKPMKAPWAAGYPPPPRAAMTAITGAMNAKLDPR